MGRLLPRRPNANSTLKATGAALHFIALRVSLLPYGMPWWIKAGIAFLLAVVLIAVFIVGAGFWAFLRPPPSDLELTARFQKHRQDFEALTTLAASDSELAAAYRDPVLGFRMTTRKAATRRGEGIRETYRVLLRRAGVRALWRSPAGMIKFEMMANYDVRKGLVFSTEPLSPIKPSLDELVGPMGNGYMTVAYRPLAARWYVFLEARE